jgi:hypothetical protein
VGEEHRDLPGPSRVVTGPGQVAFDPVTGARRRRTGISSVPTSVILPDNLPPPPPPQHASAVEEYEAESEEEEEDSLREEEGEAEQRESSFSAKRTGAGMEGLFLMGPFVMGPYVGIPYGILVLSFSRAQSIKKLTYWYLDTYRCGLVEAHSIARLKQSGCVCDRLLSSSPSCSVADP